jgi:molybdate transport repressor ModE-like protein
MSRPRIVHRSFWTADRGRVIQTAVDTSIPAEPEPAAAGAEDVMRQVRMESIHPLRLRILLEIERTGSISAAAERCAIGQPSASMHLRTLEGAIGRTLVTRSRRGSSLTAAGKVVAIHAARLLSTLDRMRSDLDALVAHTSGELSVAASLTASVALVPPILRQFAARHPGMTVEVRTAPSKTVVREVARAGADIGIAGEVGCLEGVLCTPILVDELVGIAPVGLFSSANRLMNRSELARTVLLLGADGSSTRIVTERCLLQAEYRPARIWAFDSYEAIKRAVADGLGVSFISRLLVGEELERGELASFRLAGVNRMVRPIHALQPSATELTPQGAAFMSLLLHGSRASSAHYRHERA